jgi:hypothetical protein
MVASSYVSDRNNKKTTGSIQPDILIDSKDDNKIISAAIEWLLK